MSDLLALIDGLKDRGLLDRVDTLECDGAKLTLLRPAPAPGDASRERDKDADEFDPYASSHGGHDGR